jgi:hypothetical protein
MLEPTSRIVEHSPHLDVFAIAAKHGGCLTGSDKAAILVATETGERTIQIEWEEIVHGRRRPWFRCPQCLRRCRYVFPPECGCVQCLKLDNLVRHTKMPAMHKVYKLRQMLGNDDVAFTPIPRRKAHHKAYNRLRARILLAEDKAFEEM